MNMIASILTVIMIWRIRLQKLRNYHIFRTMNGMEIALIQIKGINVLKVEHKYWRIYKLVLFSIECEQLEFAEVKREKFKKMNIQ